MSQLAINRRDLFRSIPNGICGAALAAKFRGDGGAAAGFDRHRARPAHPTHPRAHDAARPAPGGERSACRGRRAGGRRHPVAGPRTITGLPWRYDGERPWLIDRLGPDFTLLAFGREGAAR